MAALPERAAARHELSGGLRDFLHAAAFLLKDGGRIYLVHLAERLAELLATMREERLEPKRLRCVHSRQGEEARMVLVEGRKGGKGGMRVEPPLIVYCDEGYSQEIQEILRGGISGLSPGHSAPGSPGERALRAFASWAWRRRTAPRLSLTSKSARGARTWSMAERASSSRGGR